MHPIQMTLRRNLIEPVRSGRDASRPISGGIRVQASFLARESAGHPHESVCSNESRAPISDATLVDIVPDDTTTSDSVIHNGPGAVLAREAQRSGDPDVGYQVLLNGKLCRMWNTRLCLRTGEGTQLRTRRNPCTGQSPDLPYYLSLATDVSDIDLVSPNCLTCHAGTINGQLVVGLGSTDLDYTSLCQEALQALTKPQLRS